MNNSNCNFLFVCFLLTFISGTASATSSKMTRALSDIRSIEAAIEMFKLDVGRYPVNDEGIGILADPPEKLPRPEGYKEDGYLDRIPNDPWGSEYQYEYPGNHNPEKFDLWTLGADGKPGGEGINGDYGNWPGSFEEARKHVYRNRIHETILSIVVFGVPVGLGMGLPVYLCGLFLRLRTGMSVRSAATGFHLGVLIYLVLLIPVVGISVTLVVAL